MIETYVTYKLWDGCKAPNNLESGTRLVGQRVGSVSVDRDALLGLAREMKFKAKESEAYFAGIHPGEVVEYARRIREACGEG